MTRLFLLAVALSLAQAPPKDFAALQHEYNQRTKELGPCLTRVERSAYATKLRALDLELAPGFRRFADQQPNSWDGNQARIWLVLHGSDEEVHRTATELLKSQDLGRNQDDLCFTLATATRPATCEALSRFAAELRAPSQQLFARLCLGKNKLMLAHLGARARAGDVLQEGFGPLVDEASHSWLAKLDAAALEREGVRLLEALAGEASDAQTLGRKITDSARGALFELRKLALGAIVPDLEGEGLDGRKLSLASYRGKVVLLVFWFIDCPMCMDALPRERALLERLKDKPFAILGVDGDSDRDAALALEKSGRLTWPSFWDGSITGPIATRWNITTWPRTFVLDREGRIRFKDVFGEDLDRAVDSLMAETAAPAGGK